MRVFVAMSGGVDSSVSAALMLEAGHEVTGVTMRLLPGDGSGVGASVAEAVGSASRVCEVLGIPHQVLDCQGVFESDVVAPFADAYAAGRTPNPCIVCNDRVKFGELLTRVRALGADALATGHYARISQDGSVAWLERGLDSGKDQSYFLYRLTEPAIDHVLFPVGELEKAEVRRRADALGLPSATRPDSQEVCFVPAGSHAELVAARHPSAATPGEIVNTEGIVLGMHHGLAYYTVGQRKGLGVAAPQPLFVQELDAVGNRLVVGPRAAESTQEIIATDVVWRAPLDEMDVTVQTRYRMKPVRARVHRESDADGQRLLVRPREPLGAVAPGQAVVCYSGDRVVGGGSVQCVR